MIFKQQRVSFPPRKARFWGRGLLLLGIGLGYAGFIQWTSWYIPCWFRLLTGWACPGCGITHFCLDLLQGKFGEAVQQNLALAVLAPLWVLLGIGKLLLHGLGLRLPPWVFQIWVWSNVFLLAGFGILRNLPQFSFLLPLYMR